MALLPAHEIDFDRRSWRTLFVALRRLSAARGIFLRLQVADLQFGILLFLGLRLVLFACHDSFRFIDPILRAAVSIAMPTWSAKRLFQRWCTTNDGRSRIIAASTRKNCAAENSWMEELEYLSASAFFGRAGAACMSLRLCPRGLSAGTALGGNLFARGGGSAQDEWVGGMAQSEEPNFGATKRR